MPVFQIKSIKPQRLQIDAIVQELYDELRIQGEATEDEFARTVATWNNPPEFDSIVDVSGKDASVFTGPTGDAEAVQHFEWVDQGTRPHIIRPRQARRLRFSAKYTAKTRRGWIGSQRGGPSGGQVYANIVHHPGTQARELSAAIQKRRKKPFTAGMIAAMQRGAGKAF